MEINSRIRQIFFLIFSLWVALGEEVFKNKNVDCFASLEDVFSEAKALAIQSITNKKIDVSKIKILANSTKLKCNFDLHGTITFNPKICLQDLTEMIANVTEGFNDISNKDYSALILDIINVVFSYEAVYKDCVQSLDIKNDTFSANNQTNDHNLLKLRGEINSFLNGEAPIQGFLERISVFGKGNSVNFEKKNCKGNQLKFVRSLQIVSLSDSDESSFEIMELISYLGDISRVLLTECPLSSFHSIMFRLKINLIFKSLLNGHSNLSAEASSALNLLNNITLGKKSNQSVIDCSSAKSSFIKLYLKENLQKTFEKDSSLMEEILNSLKYKCN